MSSKYTVGYGSQLAIALITAGTIGTYKTVAQTRDLDTPKAEVDDINITNNDSPSNTKEHAPGMLEPGELEWECVYSKADVGAAAGFVTLKAYEGDGNIYSIKETFPDGAMCIFPCYVKSVYVTGKTEDEALIGHFSVKATGKQVWS